MEKSALLFAQTVVVVLSETARGMLKFPAVLATPVANAVPVQPELLCSVTVEVGRAVPAKTGRLLLAGEAGVTEERTMFGVDVRRNITTPFFPDSSGLLPPPP